MSGYKKTDNYYAPVQDKDLPPAVEERNDGQWAMPPEPEERPYEKLKKTKGDLYGKA